MIRIGFISGLISPELFLAVGGFIFNLLVLPTLVNSDAAIPRIQSVLSAVVLVLCFSIPYYMIGFYWSATANIIGGLLWTIVAIYRAPQSSQSNTMNSSTPQSAD